MSRASQIALATAAAISALAIGDAAAIAGTLHGIVYADVDGDGRQGPLEVGIAGAVVAYDTGGFVVTDATGQFDLAVPSGGTGIAWVRVPSGYAPGPVWQNVTGQSLLALGVRPVAVQPGPLTFVVASDAHITQAQPFFDDVAAAAKHATALDPPPAFFAITGDVTQGDLDADFDLMDEQTADLGVPFVPVPGNHDWYDNGDTWHRRYGPDNYSFDVGTTHFVIWNMSLGGTPFTTASDSAIAAYLTAELAHVDPSMTIVAMSHAPPDPATVATLRSLGVAYVLTGHTHTNHVIDHDGMIELNTEPFLMGGLDFTPAGYRVVSLEAGKLSSYHRTVVDQPYLQLIGPAPGQCVPPSGGDLLAAAEIDASPVAVTASFDFGPALPAVATGGWTFHLSIPPLPAGDHLVTLTATSTGAGTTTTQLTAFQVCASSVPPAPEADWAQLGGDATHQNATSSPLPPPLVPRWTQPVGGQILQAAPVIAQGMVFASASDLGDDTAGGVVAFDLVTGAQLWRAPAHVRGGPAVVGDVVVVAEIDGTVLGLDRTTGAQVWSAPLGSGLPPAATFIDAPPAIDGGDVFIGNQNAFASLDAATGAQSWLTDPTSMSDGFATDDAMAVGGGLVVGSFARNTGVSAWDRDTGELVWNVTSDPGTTGVNGSPVITDTTVYIVNSDDEVLALELGTGKTTWNTKLDTQGFDWGYAIAGGPAYANGVLVVPTLYGDLVGLDGNSGSVMWRHTTAAGPLRTTHYRGSGMAGYEGSPVIANGVVWAADTAGVLVALDLHSGQVLWQTSLGAPVLASLAVADGWLVAATYDGTVHALSLGYADVAEPPDSGGCCDSGRGGRGGVLLGLLVGLVIVRKRRR